jgi:SpoVK/Ycf46/Vps4 family AAA+-type ATPase
MTRREGVLAKFGELMWPRDAAEPILARNVRDALTAWLTEIMSADDLAALGVKPRQRALFDGPPGVGKTTMAHHLAARIGVPMLPIQPDRLVSKYVGETGQNIGDLFQAATAGVTDDRGHSLPVLLFFEEFDSVAGTRSGEATGGADRERNAIVNVLLQRIEAYRGFLIAATNMAGAIDSAIWRRFDYHITLSLPGLEERERILARYLAPLSLSPNEIEGLAISMDGASPALIRAWCENLKREMVIGPKLGLDMTRAAVIGRIIGSVKPHPNLEPPPLWSIGADHYGLTGLSWPPSLSARMSA